VVDVSSWTEVARHEEQKIELVTTVGSIVTPIGGDYRHRSQSADNEVAEADQAASPRRSAL
jgi:hypothetical protein